MKHETTSLFGRDPELALAIRKTKILLNDGLTITEIAVKLNKSESTIRKWVDMINKGEVYKNF